MRHQPRPRQLAWSHTSPSLSACLIGGTLIREREREVEGEREGGRKGGREGGSEGGGGTVLKNI
jgi:hypothetical protein